VTQAALDQLAGFAASFTGFSREAIPEPALRKAAEQLELQCGSEDEVLLRAQRHDREVIHALCQAVSVGETFFFRQPEHFRFIASTMVPQWTAERRSEITAWSAGCATGEETYSLAACLLDLLPADVTISVLGTDLVERNLTAAREGNYGAWSRRASGPMLHPVFADTTAGRSQVLPRLQKLVRFAPHNLLEPPPGMFDLVFCRNVLVYFAPSAAAIVMKHLMRSLGPGGALFFGSMDVTQKHPEQLEAVRPAELQIFRRPVKKEVPKIAPQPVYRPLPQQRTGLDPIPLHTEALLFIERGNKHRAQEILESLPFDYLPGLLERAMQYVRAGEKTAAATLMRAVLRRTDQLQAEEPVTGPETLPAKFYRDSALTYLRGAQGK
jgi:chemotaxis protein methyltransferase CheR